MDPGCFYQDPDTTIEKSKPEPDPISAERKKRIRIRPSKKPDPNPQPWFKDFNQDQVTVRKFNLFSTFLGAKLLSKVVFLHSVTHGCTFFIVILSSIDLASILILQHCTENFIKYKMIN